MIKYMKIILLLISPFASANNKEWGTYINAKGFFYSESIPIKSLFNKMDGDLEQGRFIYTHNSVESGISYTSNFYTATLGYMSRYDYLIRYSEDAIFLLHRKGNDLDAPIRDYNLLLQGNRAKSTGKTFELNFNASTNITLMLKGSWFKSQDLLDGIISGALTSDETGLEYNNLSLNYTYDQDLVFGRSIVEPGGKGMAMDAGLKIQLSDAISLSLSSYDLYSKIKWDQAPFTIAHQNTDTVMFDDQGMISVKPSLSGFYGKDNIIQRFTTRNQYEATYTTATFSYWVKDEVIASEHFAQLGTRYTSTYGNFSTAFYPAQQALELGYKSDHIAVLLKSDNLDFNKAKLLAIETGISYQW